MMWWAVWCAVLVAGAGAAAAPADSLANLSPLDLVQIDPPAPDDEGAGYAAMGGRYTGSPWLYLLAEMPRDSQVASSELAMRHRRGFSVNPAVDVLQRGAYNNFIERLAQNNRDILNRVGKREVRRVERRAFEGEAQDAITLDQQPHGGAATEAATGSGTQANARSQPAAGGRQPALLAKRWQTRILGEICIIPLRQLEPPPSTSLFRCKLFALSVGARCCVNSHQTLTNTRTHSSYQHNVNP